MLQADNEKGLKIIVSPVGASLRSVTFNGDEILNTPKNDADFFNKESLLGKTLGPILNNKENKEINGKSYSFDKDYSLNNVLFAGTPYMDKNLFSMTYSYKKKNMKDGLPGNVQYYISYSMSSSSNELLVDYRAVSDRDAPISISNKIGFILENDVKLEIESDYKHLENGEIIDLHTNDDLLKKKEIYHKQILYRFSKK